MCLLLLAWAVFHLADSTTKSFFPAGMYFTSCVEHIKFVDFCGMYRVPLMHYLCSSRCSSKTPDYYRAQSSESDSEEDEPAARMKRVLLG